MNSQERAAVRVKLKHSARQKMREFLDPHEYIAITGTCPNCGRAIPKAIRQIRCSHWEQYPA